MSASDHVPEQGLVPIKGLTKLTGVIVTVVATVTGIVLILTRNIEAIAQIVPSLGG